MALIKKASIILYRFAEKGLEVLMLNDPDDLDSLELPKGKACEAPIIEEASVLHLDTVDDESGNKEKVIAVERDWHEIPSLKSLLKDDVYFVKDTVKGLIPELMEKGTYLTIKDALKKALPKEYKVLKELKDTLIERNSVTNL